MLKSSNGLRVDNFFGAQRFFRAHEPKLGEACSMDGGRDHGASDPPASAERRPRLFGQGVVRSIVFFANKNRALLEIGGCSGFCPEGPGRVAPKCAFMKAARSGRAAGLPRAGIRGMLHGRVVGGHLRRSRPSCDERCGRVSVPVALRAAPSMVGAAGAGVHPAVHPAGKVRGQSGTARPVVSA